MRNCNDSASGLTWRALLALPLVALTVVLVGCGDDQNKQQLATATVLGTRLPRTPMAATTPQPGQVALCYSTGSADYPYVMVSVDAGSDAEQQYLQDPKNIVPAPTAGCPAAGTRAPSRTPPTAIAAKGTRGTQAAMGTASPSIPVADSATGGRGTSTFAPDGGQSPPQAGRIAGPPVSTSPMPVSLPTDGTHNTPIPPLPVSQPPPAQTVTAVPQPTYPLPGSTATPIPPQPTGTPIQQPTGTSQPAPSPTYATQPTAVPPSTPVPTIVSQPTATTVPTQDPSSTSVVIPTSTSIATPMGTPVPPSVTPPRSYTATPLAIETATSAPVSPTDTPFSGTNGTPQPTKQPAMTPTP